MYIRDFAQKFSKIADPKYYESNEKVCLSDSYSNRIIKCIQFLSDHDQEDLAKRELNAILEKPSIENGAVYEVLAYQWFHEMSLSIDYQPEILKENALKAMVHILRMVDLMARLYLTLNHIALVSHVMLNFNQHSMKCGRRIEKILLTIRRNCEIIT